MAIILKTEKEIALMRQSGAILASTLNYLISQAKAGITTKDLDILAENFIQTQKARSAFKGFQGFPASICTCVNEEIVHGIPHPEKILKNGDILTIDCGIEYQGLITDSARTIPIGEIPSQTKKLLKGAEEALESAIRLIKPGIYTSEISKKIEETAKKYQLQVIYELTGHGVGKKLHEDPLILNYFDGQKGIILKAGMTLAIEPIFSLGTYKIKTNADGWTIQTKDDSLATQVEDTILVTKKSCEILTKLRKSIA